jgi:hypothetical protein
MLPCTFVNSLLLADCRYQTQDKTCSKDAVAAGADKKSVAADDNTHCINSWMTHDPVSHSRKMQHASWPCLI